VVYLPSLIGFLEEKVRFVLRICLFLMGKNIGEGKAGFAGGFAFSEVFFAGKTW